MHLTSEERFTGFRRGMGIGGWLTNYKRFSVLPPEWRMPITIGDMEHFESYITEEDVRRIVSFGLDHIRLGFDQIVLEESPGVFREPVLKLLDRFIDRCAAHRMNLVLNLHKALGNYCDVAEDLSLMDDAGLRSRFIAFWLALERRWHDHSDLVFELLNEVRDVPAEQWNSLARETIAAIRRQNPTRKIIIGGTCWNHCSTLPQLELFDDPNVIYTFHCYDPFEFTHQRGVLQAQMLYYNRAMKWPGEIGPYREYHQLVHKNPNAYPEFEYMDKAFLRRTLEPAFAFLKNHPDKILWCGEFGTIRHCRIEYRENWMADMISLLREHGIPYCVWNYLSTPNDGNRFSLVDDDTREILSPRLLSIIRGETD